MMQTQDELLTIEELAVYLKVSKSWVYQRTTGPKQIPHFKAGGGLRFYKHEVVEYLKKGEVIKK